MKVEDESMLAGEVQPDGTPVEDQIIKHVRDLEAWYSAEFERRLGQITDLLNAQLQSQIQELRTQYDRLSISSAATTTSERPQTDVVAASACEKILEEIRQSEAVAQKCAAELERMVGDDSVSLGLLLQMRNQQLELKAYLRGLKFCADTASGSPSTAKPE